MSKFDANSLFQDDNDSLDTVSPPIEPSVNIARDGLPIEVMNYVNDYNQQKEQEANYVAGYGLGFTGEIGTGLALSYKLNSAGRYTNAVRNAKYLYNSIRGVQAANIATSAKAVTPVGAATQVAGFAGTEAAIWATSNFFGQSIRKAYGVQDKIYAGELISTAVFGSIAQPIEKGMEGFKIGERLIKSTNWKISDGLVDLGAWKAREVVIKGVPKMVSGATLGLAESALRQELAIQVFEDQESRNTWDYIISTGAGAGINGLFGIFSKTGAWGRTQANTLSQRAVDRMDEAIELINADIAKLGSGRNAAAKKRRLRNKLKEHEDARAILQDNVEHFKQADEINTKVENEKPAQKPLDIDEKPPKSFDDEPEVEADLAASRERLDFGFAVNDLANELYTKATGKKYKFREGDRDLYLEMEAKAEEILKNKQAPEGEAPATPKETPEATPAPKDTPVPTNKLDQEIEQWDKDWKKAVEGDTGSTVVENIIIRANKLFDNAIFNENVALRKMAGETIERKTLVEYREAIVTQIKLLNSVFAQLNSIGGRAVRANRTDLEEVVNRSVDSQNTAQLKESLNALKTRLDEILGDEADDFVPTITKILDEDDVTPTGKGEGIDSSATAKVQAALDKRIAKLQKQLDDLVNNKPKEEGKGKGSRTEDAQIAALKNSIKNVKRYIAENEKIIKLQKEADRLVEVSKRDAPDEMQGELKGSKRKPKPDEPSPEIKKLKGEIAAAKKYFRERLRNLAKTEQKALLNRDRLELYKAIRNYTDSEIAQNATNNWIKGIRGARLIRKTSLVASVTSVEAGVATGAIEILKQYPRALATRILKRGKVGDKFMMHDLEGASYAFQYLLNKENRKQLWKHMSRAFKEGEDPMFDKSSRYMDDTPIDQQIMPRGTRKVMDKAIRDAEDAALGIEGVNKFLKDNLRLGRFMDILSMGARGILAADSGFKKVLFEQKALVEFRQQGTLKFPNDPAKAKAYSDELFKNAFTESDGLHILGKVEELEYDFMKITENLMMAAKSNNIEDVADNLIRQRLIEPIKKMMPDSDASIRGSFTSALLETVAFTFYKTAVYTATKSFTLANPLRVTGLKLNPYNKVISDLNRSVATERIAYKRFREQLKESPNEANTKRIKKEMADSNTRINEFNTRIDRAEKRHFKYNQEVLVDVMIQIGVGGMAFGAGYAGYATGSNAFLTDAQKERNPNLARFQFMGQDYKAAAPIVFLVAIMSDLGRYAAELENKGKDGQPKNLSKKTTPLTVMIQSVVAAANEMPTNQVVRDMKTLVSERSADVVAKWISSYVPNPQQVKKITRKITNGDSIADLRGASFGERLVYGAFGAGNKKIRLNMMGEPETSSHTAWHTVNRYAGARQRPYEPWEELVAADKEAVIPIEPSSSLEGTNMKNFVDEDGIDLYYHFKLRVAKYGLQDKMNDYAKSVDTGQLQIEGDETINLGLQDFNNELRYHYKIIKEELLSDQRFLNKFIDENDKPILDYINDSEEFMTIDPPKPMELKTFKDILPKF